VLTYGVGVQHHQMVGDFTAPPFTIGIRRR
jgi:hypothetical protein